MKKLFIAVVLMMLIVAVGGQSVFAGSNLDEGCKVTVLDGGKKMTSCVTYIQPSLDPYRVGGYSYLEATGFSMMLKDGDVVVYQIAPDLGTFGSRVSGTADVTGFYTVDREVGGFIYFPMNLCEITYGDGVRSSYCFYPQGVKPNLPADQVGGYSYDQVTGLQIQQNETGGFDIVRIAPNTAELGSAYLSYEVDSLSLNVAGFVSIQQQDGSYRYYPID